jgi:Rha family phage regulatory protein
LQDRAAYHVQPTPFLISTLDNEMKTELVAKNESGILVTDSLKLSELFERRHDSVSRTIKGIIKDMDEDNRKLHNFVELEERTASGQKRKVYVFGEELALIITGRLTGKNALVAQFKLAKEFIAMRDYIKTLSQSDAEMLRLTRINPNTLKAITGERSNNAVRENYKALIDAELLEEHTKIIFKRVYLPTEKGLEYVKTSHHDIMRFKPQYHELIVEAVNEYREKLSGDNADLFLDDESNPKAPAFLGAIGLKRILENGLTGITK